MALCRVEEGGWEGGGSGSDNVSKPPLDKARTVLTCKYITFNCFPHPSHHTGITQTPPSHYFSAYLKPPAYFPLSYNAMGSSEVSLPLTLTLNSGALIPTVSVPQCLARFIPPYQQSFLSDQSLQNMTLHHPVHMERVFPQHLGPPYHHRISYTSWLPSHKPGHPNILDLSSPCFWGCRAA